MAKSAKRAPLATAEQSSQSRKKAKTLAPPRAKKAAAFSGDDEDAPDGGLMGQDFGDYDNGEDSGDESFDEEDSEVNEFELDEEDDEGEELIQDDGEDLMAGIDDMDDLDEDDDDDGSESAVAPPPLPIKKANVRNSKAAPALKPAELRALAFAELTASPISNVTATQVTTLLAPLSPPTPATSPLQPLLKSLHAHITSLPNQKSTSLAGLRKKGVVVPTVPGEEGKWGALEFAWEKPEASDVRIIGRWAWGGSSKIKGEYIVDMAIGMPESLLQPKDYLSPRFLVKSTHYLVTLASLLPESLGPVALCYTRLPSFGWALEVRSTLPKDSKKAGLAVAKGVVLRLRVVWPVDYFPLAKLDPSSNIARPKTTPSDISQSAPIELPATPIHCSSLHFASLSLLTSHLTFHHTLSVSRPSYPSTSRLLQAWATRRSHGATLGLSDEFWSWCVARTLDWGVGSKIGDGAALGGETWSGWRKAVEWLAGVDWVSGVWFRTEGDKAYSKEAFRSSFKGKPIFVDPTGTVNLVAGVDLATLEILKLDAKATISLLLTEGEDEKKFQGLFLQEIRECERFDNFVNIMVPTTLIESTFNTDPAALDHADSTRYFVSAVSATLQRALGSRVRALQLSIPPPSPISAKGPTSKPESVTLTLGLVLNSAEAGRLVDQGPSAEDEAACAEFSAFWGPKSELRRFKDGSILESVVWEEPSKGGLGQQRNKMVSQIVRYILDVRHQIPISNVDVFAGAMDHLLVEQEGIRRAIYLEDSVASNKGFVNIVGAFDEISRTLKELPDLPLAINSVQASTPGLRYSSIFTPSPRRLKQFEHFPDATKYIEVHDILLTLEGSGRWPDDLEGVQKIKAAFLTKMAEGLNSLHTVVQASVAFDLSARPTDDNVSLEVMTASGYAFRARISYDRTLLLLQTRGGNLGPSTAASDSSLDLYNQRFVHAPRHHAAIATLQSHFTSFSPTVRLVRRWLSSHMLASYFPVELVEILSASVFIDPLALYDPPSSGTTGFARVMEKLASWDWREEPLLVSLYTFFNSTTASRRPSFPTLKKAIAIAAFQRQRLADPAVNEYAWTICTEEDPEGTVWGRRVGKVLAGRVKGLAKATLKTMNEGLRAGSLIVEQLFNPPLADYQFIIRLDPSVVPRHFQAISPDHQALVRQPHSSSVIAGSMMGDVADTGTIQLGWDPVTDFVQELERLYPSVFLLFYSPDGGSVIGGIWNPSAERPRPWRIGIGFPVKPVVGDAKQSATSIVKSVVLDKEAVFAEIERLGRGLVVSAQAGGSSS